MKQIIVNTKKGDKLPTNYYISRYGEVFGPKKKLKPQFDADGYHIVGIHTKQGRYTLKVHRLVAIAFIENKENKPQVNHKDGNKTNNNEDNLEWSTNSENTNHALRLGLKIGSLKDYKRKCIYKTEDTNHNKKPCAKAKLTNLQVMEIRMKAETDKTMTKTLLASQYGVNRTTVEDILSYKTWKHLN